MHLDTDYFLLEKILVIQVLRCAVAEVRALAFPDVNRVDDQREVRTWSVLRVRFPRQFPHSASELVESPFTCLVCEMEPVGAAGFIAFLSSESLSHCFAVGRTHRTLCEGGLAV